MAEDFKLKVVRYLEGLGSRTQNGGQYIAHKWFFSTEEKKIFKSTWQFTLSWTKTFKISISTSRRGDAIQRLDQCLKSLILYTYQVLKANYCEK